MSIRVIFTCLIISLFMQACNSHDNGVYIISKTDSLVRISHTNDHGIVVMPPVYKYASSAFVIDSASNLYYYSLPEINPANRPGCATDMPEYIGLQPNQMFCIPKGSEMDFFKSNVLSLKKSSEFKDVVIGSFKDTINSVFVKQLLKISNVQKGIYISVRLALPEEREVLKYKLAGLYYEPKL